MGSYKTFRIFNIPQTTLEACVKDRQRSSSETVKTKLGRKQVPPCEAENDLAGKKIFWLDSGIRHAPRLPTFCKKRN
jgi:hypothetical protein